MNPIRSAVPEDSAGFVNLTDEVPDALLDIRYFGTFNFIGDRVRGYEAPVALITREAADALRRASDAIRERGMRFRVFDAYRPQSAVDHFVEWAEDVGDTRMKALFYPDVDKSRLFELGFIARKSGHSRGSTVDLTLFDEKTQRDLDMGGTFDFFGEISHAQTALPLTGAQRENRALLQSLMLESGFRGIDSEWWHFTLENEPYPDTYFAFPVKPL